MTSFSLFICYPQVMAIATLLCFNHPSVFTGVVKIRNIYIHTYILLVDPPFLFFLF